MRVRRPPNLRPDVSCPGCASATATGSWRCWAAGARALASALFPQFLAGPLQVLFALTMSMLILRRRGAAVAAAMLLLMLSDAHWVLGQSHGLVLVSALVEVALVWTVLFVTLLHFGLLALVSAFFCLSILQRWPLTLDASAWYAGTSLLGMLILATVAGAAVFVARGVASAWRRAVLGIPSQTGV